MHVTGRNPATKPGVSVSAQYRRCILVALGGRVEGSRFPRAATAIGLRGCVFDGHRGFSGPGPISMFRLMDSRLLAHRKMKKWALCRVLSGCRCSRTSIGSLTRSRPGLHPPVLLNHASPGKPYSLRMLVFDRTALQPASGYNVARLRPAARHWVGTPATSRLAAGIQAEAFRHRCG